MKKETIVGQFPFTSGKPCQISALNFDTMNPAQILFLLWFYLSFDNILLLRLYLPFANFFLLWFHLLPSRFFRLWFCLLPGRFRLLWLFLLYDGFRLLRLFLTNSHRFHMRRLIVPYRSISAPRFT